MGLFNWQKGKIDDLIRDFLYRTGSDDNDEDVCDDLTDIGQPAAESLLAVLKREKNNRNQIYWLDALLLIERICNRTEDKSLIEEGINIFSEDMNLHDLLHLLQHGINEGVIYEFALQELFVIGDSDIDFLISEVVGYTESLRQDMTNVNNNTVERFVYYVPDGYLTLLCKLKCPKVIDQLIKWLGDITLLDPLSINRVLVDIGSQSAMPVINLLLNSNDEIKKRAAIALGKIGDLRAIEPLNNTLQNDSLPDVKFSAAEALERIGGPSVNALIRSLHNQDQTVRKYAADALGFIGDKRALDSLATLLKDQDKEVREKVEKALHRICEKCNLDYQQVIKEYQIKTIKTIPEEKSNIKDRPLDSLETIKKLKELLDIGAITEEEFQMKKNKLMNEI